MTGYAVFLISAATLAFEVLLTRIFSISQWNHLSFMVISIALFGFAASGTLLGLQDKHRREWIDRLSTPEGQVMLCAGFSITALGGYALLVTSPLDYFRLPVEPEQFLYLLAAYIALIIPFFFTGLLIIVAYINQPAKSGRIYFANMTGSAAGAVYPALLLPYLAESRLSLVTAVLPFMALLPLAARKLFHSGTALSYSRQVIYGLLWLILALFVGFSIANTGWLNIRISPYKALAQTLQMPETRISDTVNHLEGRIDLVESPFIRYAPGLSLKFSGRLPAQDAVFRDGENRLVLYDVSRLNALAFANQTLSYLGYRLVKESRSVLVLQNGGGIAIACALASGADRITIVESYSEIARIVRNHYQLPVVHQPHRVYLARTDKKFNLIQVENWGTSLPGTAALNQDYALTGNAIRQYLQHLDADGILIMSRTLMLPPSDSIRLWSAAYEGLATLGIRNPQRHIAVLRNWDTYTMLVALKPFENQPDIQALAKQFNFDLVYMDGLSPAAPNQFNAFKAPFHYRALRRLAAAYQAGHQNTFFKNYPMDIRPQNDNRPFPARVLKWTRLGDIYKSTGSRMYTLMLSGEVVVAVVFLQALGVALLLIVLPVIGGQKITSGLAGSHTIYFTTVGIGFMAVELFFLKQFVLICGDPITSFTVVLAGMLVFSGIGGFLSQKIGPRHLPLILVGIVLLLIGYLLLREPLMHILVSASKFWRITGAFALLMPVGILAGLPFPLGMRYILRSAAGRSMAWTINGCASVLSSILAAQVAISHGIAALMIGGIGAYGIALVSTAQRRIGRIDEHQG